MRGRNIVNRNPLPPTSRVEYIIPSDQVKNINEEKNNSMLNYQQIIEIYERNKIDYNNLKNTSEFNIIDSNDVDVSIIIPVKDREDFNFPLVSHLKDAMSAFNEKTYSITFVEHSDVSTHRDLCNNNTNHIWIKKNSSEFFNKCLAMNVGAFFSNRAKHYLFHDIDLLVDKNFFINIFKNLSRVNDGCALQAFGGRKVVVMNNELTNRVIKNKTKIEEVIPGESAAPYSTPGAPGGSIFISHDSFYNIGGFDPEFFHSYSCEDAFFYHKAEVRVGIQGCDDPLVDVFHMDHPRTNGSDNPDMANQYRINASFKSMNIKDKIKFIDYISNKIKSRLDEKGI
jgi:hypothetical protein